MAGLARCGHGCDLWHYGCADLHHWCLCRAAGGRLWMVPGRNPERDGVLLSHAHFCRPCRRVFDRSLWAEAGGPLVCFWHVCRSRKCGCFGWHPLGVVSCVCFDRHTRCRNIARRLDPRREQLVRQKTRSCLRANPHGNGSFCDCRAALCHVGYCRIWLARRLLGPCLCAHRRRPAVGLLLVFYAREPSEV